jgi:hypothetical protein
MCANLIFKLGEIGIVGISNGNVASIKWMCWKYARTSHSGEERQCASNALLGHEGTCNNKHPTMEHLSTDQKDPKGVCCR